MEKVATTPPLQMRGDRFEYDAVESHALRGITGAQRNPIEVNRPRQPWNDPHVFSHEFNERDARHAAVGAKVATSTSCPLGRDDGRVVGAVRGSYRSESAGR